MSRRKAKKLFWLQFHNLYTPWLNSASHNKKFLGNSQLFIPHKISFSCNAHCFFYSIFYCLKNAVYYFHKKKNSTQKMPLSSGAWKYSLSSSYNGKTMLTPHKNIEGNDFFELLIA